MRQERDEQQVDDEPAAVLGDDDALAQSLTEGARVVEGRLARGDAPHHLEQLHHGRGVEEVGPDHSIRTPRRACDLDDRERGGVRRQDGVLRDDVIELLEQSLLRRQLLDDRLDAEIALREVLEAGGEREQPGHALDVVVTELAGLPAALERGVHPALARRELRRPGLGDDGADAVARAHLGDPRTHQPGADDPHAFDLHVLTLLRWLVLVPPAQSARGRAARAPMMVAMASPGAIALVSDDLMFASQLTTTMRRAGGSAAVVVGDAVPAVDTVFVDLNAAIEERLELISRLRSERPALDIVGFCGHEERDVRRRALASGATRVINNGTLQIVALRLSGLS